MRPTDLVDPSTVVGIRFGMIRTAKTQRVAAVLKRVPEGLQGCTQLVQKSVDWIFLLNSSYKNPHPEQKP